MSPTPPPPRQRILLPFLASCFVLTFCMAWADASKYLVDDRADYQYFPPFEKSKDRLMTDHLGAEYLSIAFALRDGRGFSDPFKIESGPTAWMPPILPYLQAAILWLADDDLVVLKYVVLVFQLLAYVFTAWVVLAATSRAFAPRRRCWVATLVIVMFFAKDFHTAFQLTHDPWLIIGMMNLLFVGFALLPDEPRRVTPVAWGGLGGVAALAGPVLGLVWFVLTVVRWPRAWKRWLVGVAAAAVVMTPWVVRNYVVFHRLIPVKSNLFYELHQSQCLTKDGIVGGDSGFDTHPWAHPGEERDKYYEMGEMAFLDEKRRLFLAAFGRAPDDFAVRSWNRLASATMVYVPFMRKDEKLPPDLQSRYVDVVHPLPFLALVVMMLTPRPLHRYELAAATVYVGWLVPYVVVSYYNRYGFPLIAVKIFLCVAGFDRLWVGVRSLLRPDPDTGDS